MNQTFGLNNPGVGLCWHEPDLHSERWLSRQSLAGRGLKVSQGVRSALPEANGLIHISPGQRPGFIATNSQSQAEGLPHNVAPCHISPCLRSEKCLQLLRAFQSEKPRRGRGRLL